MLFSPVFMSSQVYPNLQIRIKELSKQTVEFSQQALEVSRVNRKQRLDLMRQARELANVVLGKIGDMRLSRTIQRSDSVVLFYT